LQEIKPTLLFSKNSDVDSLNKTELAKLTSAAEDFDAVDKVMS
jgi:hypothetical protein